MHTHDIYNATDGIDYTCARQGHLLVTGKPRMAEETP